MSKRNRITVVVLATTLFVCACCLQARTNVPVDGMGAALAEDSVSNKIHVIGQLTVQTPDNVTVIDGATDQTSIVPVGHGAGSIAANSLTDGIYVTCTSG